MFAELAKVMCFAVADDRFPAPFSLHVAVMQMSPIYGIQYMVDNLSFSSVVSFLK